jgi:hypothetical protein
VTSTSRKQSAILHDDEVEECLLVSESEERSSDSEFYSDSELDDCALLDVVVNDDSDEVDDDIQDFVCVGGHEQSQVTKKKFHE